MNVMSCYNNNNNNNNTIPNTVMSNKELHSFNTLAFEPAQWKDSNNQLSVMYLCCHNKVAGKFLYIPCGKHTQLLCDLLPGISV